MLCMSDIINLLLHCVSLASELFNFRGHSDKCQYFKILKKNNIKLKLLLNLSLTYELIFGVEGFEPIKTILMLSLKKNVASGKRTFIDEY